ncbi:hypothetical protein ACHAW5_005460 [Stephanodiscus triporus]|uniref:Uncharacterized protein n=1 Tax=Stephanodiscus triporus TaxID=2934178 RepID=A0ABD3QH46_9STRA
MERDGGEEKAGSVAYANGAILGYKRALRNQYNHTSLIKIKGVDSREDASASAGGGKAGPDRNYSESTGDARRGGRGGNGVVRCEIREGSSTPEHRGTGRAADAGRGPSPPEERNSPPGRDDLWATRVSREKKRRK